MLLPVCYKGNISLLVKNTNRGERLLLHLLRGQGFAIGKGRGRSNEVVRERILAECGETGVFDAGEAGVNRMKVELLVLTIIFFDEAKGSFFIFFFQVRCANI